MLLARGGNSLWGCPTGSHPSPTPTLHSHLLRPQQIRCGGRGVSCDGEAAINSWRWAYCPRRLGDRRVQRPKELHRGEDRGRQAKAQPGLGEDTWSDPSPSGMGVNRAGGEVPPSTSTCPSSTAPATDCPPRMGAFSTGPERTQVPGTSIPHR